MNILWFLSGGATGLVLAEVCLALVRLRLRQSRQRRAAIRGYLDLIPDLTDEQRAKVQEIRKVFLPKVEGIRHSMRSGRAELAERLFEVPADRSRIDTVAERIIRHQSELEREVIEHILQEKEILSNPQRRKFHDIILEQFASGGVGIHDIQEKRN
jgi:Spy/CpxP family protein refolding chaperone